MLNKPCPAWVLHDTAAHFTIMGSSNALEDNQFTTLDIEKACVELKISSAGVDELMEYQLVCLKTVRNN